MTDWKQMWDNASDYHALMEAADEKDSDRWAQIYDACALSERQAQILRAFEVPVNVLTMVGTWCGDCVAEVPLIERLAEGSEQVTHRLVRIEDVDDAFKDRWQINGGHRVPVLFLLSEDWHLGFAWGDRPLARYRMLRNVRRAEPDLEKKEFYKKLAAESRRPEVMEKTADELLAELERAQIMFQLSPRLQELRGQAAG